MTRVWYGMVVAALAAATSFGQQRKPENYPVHPDSIRQDGVPKGTVTKYQWTTSKVFPGTHRDYWVYVPAQYKETEPACLMVFNDGRGWVRNDATPIVFDNLIHKGKMPVTIGVFIDPGVVPAAHDGALARYNRSFEYDAVGDRYARFLIDEILPEVEKVVNLKQNPNSRAICGTSSGGVAAFTAAWSRPDAFRRVYTLVGTYIGLRGAQNYSTLVRKTEAKPLRIFLQDGRNDLNIYCGDWWVANQGMLSALTYGGYEINHRWGDGYHGGKHGKAILPEVLEWLWAGYPAEVTTHYDRIGSRSMVPEALIEGEGWELVSEGHSFTEGPAVAANGELFFTDLQDKQIHRINGDGEVSVFVAESKGTNGLAFGPDGRLFGAQRDSNRVVSWSAAELKKPSIGTSGTLVAEGISPNDLVVAHNGNIYVTEPRKRTVWLIRPDGTKVTVDREANGCNGVVLSPDQSLLYVTDYAGRFVVSYQIMPDGTLTHKQAYYYLHLEGNENRSLADGMCVDANGWLLVATALGVQVCDQAGRVNLIIPSPPGERHPANVTFGGADGSTLYATCGSKVFKRKVKLKGALPWKAPIKPPKPRL